MENKTFDENWEKQHSSRQWGKYPSEMFVKFLLGNYREKDQRHKINVLEIGCGVGANIVVAAKEGFNSFAFDGSPSAIKNAGEFLASQNAKVNLAVEDAFNMDKMFGGNDFDVIFDICTLCHINYQDASTIVDKAISRLKPGGRFFSIGFAVGTWGEGLGKKVAENAYCDITEGFFKGVGFVRMATFHDIEAWGKKFANYSIEELGHTVNNRQNHIKYFILSAQK